MLIGRCQVVERGEPQGLRGQLFVRPATCCALTLGLALAATFSAAADARRTPVCTKKAGKTLLASKHARVFRKRGRVYACLYRIGRKRPGRRFQLGDDSVGNLRLAGRFVGYRRYRTGFRVTVKELRRGRIVRNARATALTPNLTRITDLELKRNGSVAWIAESIPIDGPLAPYWMPIDSRPTYEVRAADRRGELLFDRAHEIAPFSLTLSGSTLRWSKAGGLYSAVLR